MQNRINGNISIDALNKGIGSFDGALVPGQTTDLGWNLLREDLSLPAAVLYHDKLQHNLAWMKRFVEVYGVRLAPHGKTTMAPRLFEMQLDSGAWGITLATAPQVQVAYAHGVRRVLMANELIGKENMAIVGRLLNDSGFEFYCLVDSAAQIDALGAYFSVLGVRLQVLLELGVTGGRTGVRDDEQLRAVMDALDRWPGALSLAGVEVYEGVLDNEASIRVFLERAIRVTRQLLDEKKFKREPALLSGAGSAWYDVVAEVFAAAGFAEAVEIILRPGCYLTHDVGAYRAAQQKILERNPVARQLKQGLVPALHIWAYVQSIPEPERAIIGMGKRDAAFDAGFPVPALHFRPGNAVPTAASAAWSVTNMMDQHAYLKIGPGSDLRVGDMIAFDISHPCLTFDKWRLIPIVNDHYDVIDLVQTFF
ncbi:MAG: amino acid deaminase [Terracidiphilus sp.]